MLVFILNINLSLEICHLSLLYDSFRVCRRIPRICGVVPLSKNILLMNCGIKFLGNFFIPLYLSKKIKKSGIVEYGYISVPQFVYSFKKSGIDKIYKNLEFYTPQMRGIRRQTPLSPGIFSPLR